MRSPAQADEEGKFVSYHGFMEFMKPFLNGENSEDYWYDLAAEQAARLLDSFSEEDWESMIRNIGSQSMEFRKKLAYCFDDPANGYELELLLMLLDTEDRELFITCVDSLRSFVTEESADAVKKRIPMERFQYFMGEFGDVEKKVAENFLGKI